MSFDAGSVTASLTLDRSDFTRGLAAAQAEARKGVNIPVTFAIGRASMTDVITKAKSAFGAASASIPITFKVSSASVAAVLRDTKAAFRSASATVPLQFSVTQAAVTAGAVAARAAFKASGQAVSMPITFGLTAAAVAAGAVAARAAVKASGQTATMPITFTVNTASLAAATVAAKALAGATSTAAAAAAGAGGVFGFLGTKVALFGGLLNKILPDALRQVAVWHILGDAIIEFGAVVIPAAIAVGVWGIAASDAISNVVRQITNYHTVSDAFQQSLPIFGRATGALETLHKAVQPQVYQLFGDAITVANSRTGEFSKLALGTGSVLDRLGGRFAVAVTSGNGFSTFMKNAIPDVAKIGDSLGNLGGVFSNLMKAVPGYANVLLTLFDNFTKIAETATRVAEPVIAIGLALHGFILYTGLAVTAGLAMVGALGKLVVSFFTFSKSAVSAGVTAIVDFTTALWAGAAAVFGYVGEVATMILVNGAATTSAYLLAEAMSVVDATGGPVVWIAAAVIALGAFVYWMSRSKDATQQWYAGLQKTLLAAPAGFQGLSLAQADLAQGTAKVTSAQEHLNAVTKDAAPITSKAGGELGMYYGKVAKAQQAVAEYTTGQQQLQAQITRGNAVMGVWAGKFGGVAAATGLATIAGITYGDQISKNSEQQAINIAQMTAAEQGLQAMGVQAGTLGNDLQILNQQTTDQYKAIQNLNTGLATFITNVTGTQTSFDTVALGGITLAANFAQAGANVLTTRHTLDGLTVTSKVATSSIDGMSQASLTLNQAFATQVGNINTLAASWRTAGVASNLQTQGMKDAIAPMLQYAKGSQEATDQLIALAETAGAPSWVTNFSTLSKWLGNTSGAQKNLKDITNQATQQEALLSGAMQDQGKVISGQLIGDINAAVIAYYNVGPAATAFGTAIAQFGKGSTQANAAEATLEQGIIAAGKAMGDSNAQIAAQLVAVPSLGLTTKTAMKVVTGALAGSHAAWGTVAGDVLGLQIKIPGLADDITTLADRIQKTSDRSSAGHAARVGLYEDLISTGKGAQWATTQYDILTGNIGKIPKDVTTGIHVNADGSWSVGETTVSLQAASKRDISKVTGLAAFHAAGWLVPGSGTGDTVPAMLTPGEAVVPKHLVPAVAPFLAANSVPGFTTGGIVQKGNASAGAAVGRWADQQWSATYDQVDLATQTAMVNAINAAVKTANSAASAGPGGSYGGGVAQWKPDVLAVLAMLGLSSALAPQVLYQMQTESGGNPRAINLTDCLYIDCMILTQRGWLKHDEVQPGDYTIGYNKATGHSEWTAITRVVHYEDAPLVRLGNKRWSVLCTPNHRWLNETTAPQDSTDPRTCTEPGCAWPEGVRRRGATTTGGYRIHMARKHGTRLPKQAAGSEIRMVTTDEIKLSGHYRLRVAAPADTGPGLSLTDDEAELLGWILGDGHVRYAGRTTHRGRTLVTLSQAKPQFVPVCRSLVAAADPGHSEYQHTLRSGLVSYTWALNKDYGLSLLERSGYASPQQMVLGMSAAQRTAFLRGVMGAEGSAQGEHARIPQVYGPKADAIVLAIFLNGYRPSVSDKSGEDEPHGWSPSGSFGMCRPHITPLVKEDAGTGPVWCVTTDLGTWTARGDDGQPFLTGNSNAAAGDPSRGLLQTIGSTFNAWRSWSLPNDIYNPMANIYAAVNYAMHRYGLSLMSGGMGMGSGHGYAAGTSGAAPGWGVVGERGPELVRFHGGEPVIPHAASMAALGVPGYASGTGSAVALAAQIKLLRLEASLAGKVGSENRVTGLIATHLAALPKAHTVKERATLNKEIATERGELALWKSQAAALLKQIAALGGHAAVTAAGKVPAAVAAAHFGALAEAGKDLMAAHRSSATAKTLNSLIAGASKAVSDDKLLETVPGIGAKEKKQLAARRIASSRLLNFWTTESSELMAYRTQLANSNATLRKDVTAAKDMKLSAEAATLSRQLAGQLTTVRAINTWLGPTAAQTAAAAAAAKTAATAAAAATAATPAATGPSGQDLITKWLTAQGWIVGGTPTTAPAQPMQWFDSGGRLPAGLSISGNATGGSERVLSHGEEDALSRHLGGGSNVETLLRQVVKHLADAPGKTAAGVGDAINGAARGAVRRGAYTTR